MGEKSCENCGVHGKHHACGIVWHHAHDWEQVCYRWEPEVEKP